jgi:hypothetical protein
MKRLLSVTGLVMIVSAIYAQPTIIGIQAGTYSGARIDFSNNRNHFTWNRKQEMFANYEKLSMQGAALYEGKLYQFYDKGKGLLIYHSKTGKLLETKKQFQYQGATETHFGSIAFSNQKTYVKLNGEKVTTTIPLVYATGHMKPKNTVEAVDDKDNYEFVDVVDIEHDYLVKRIKFRNRYDDIICAWDFEGNRGWVIGYVKKGYATDTYCITSFNMNDIDAEGYVNEKDPVEIPNDGTLQDCEYRNGHIYFLVGWGTNAKRSTLGKIHDYDVEKKRINTTLTTNITDECEGLALDEKARRFIITSRCIYGENKGVGSWWDVKLK